MNTLSASILLRYSIVLLFGWFSIQQLINPAFWVGFLPEWTGYFPIPGEMLVRLNGWLELILALMLLCGVYTRFVATLLSLHLLGIAWTAGGATGVRDGILALCTFCLALAPPDRWTVDAKTQENKL